MEINYDKQRRKDGGLDLFSPEFKRNPYPTYARLRHEEPFHRHVTPAGKTIWFITRYDDVLAVLKDRDHFVKDPTNLASANRSVHQRRSDATLRRNMLFSDPPAHTRLRRLVSQAFTPPQVAGMAQRIRAIAERLLDEVAADGGTDLLATYALPLPLIIICDMLGIPNEDRPDLAHWSGAIISPASRGLTFRQRKRAVRRLLHYLDQAFADRRRRPRADLMSRLVLAEESGDRLSREELASMVALLLVTGHETTVNLIGNGTAALLAQSSALNWALRRPDGFSQIVPELLRFAGPVETSTGRWVRHDCTFGGYTMREGDQIRVVLSSANRDESVFANPDNLDPGRNADAHLAFGHGIHYCLGASLAQLECEIALESLFQRWPQLALACKPADLSWRPGILFRGLHHLPVRWSHHDLP